MGTLRKIERGVLRRKVGSRHLKAFYKARLEQPKKQSAFIRGIINLYKLLTNKF